MSSVDQKTRLACMWQRQSASSFKAREKHLFISHPQTWSREKNNSLGLYYLVTEPPTEKKNISCCRIKGICASGKFLQPYLLEGKISQDDRASPKTPEKTEGRYFTSRAEVRKNFLVITNPQGRSKGRALHCMFETVC